MDSYLIMLAKLPLVTPSSSSGTGSWRVPRQTATYVFVNNIFSLRLTHTGSITLSGSGMMMRSCIQPKLIGQLKVAPEKGQARWWPQGMGPKLWWPNQGPSVVHIFSLSTSQRSSYPSPLVPNYFQSCSPQSLFHLISTPLSVQQHFHISPCVKFQLSSLFLLVRSFCTSTAEEPLQSARRMFDRFNMKDASNVYQEINGFTHWLTIGKRFVQWVHSLQCLIYTTSGSMLNPLSPFKNVISLQVFI